MTYEQAFLKYQAQGKSYAEARRLALAEAGSAPAVVAPTSGASIGTYNPKATTPSPTPAKTGPRDFYKKDGSYYYVDNNQKILNLDDLKAAAKTGGKEVAPPAEGLRSGVGEYARNRAILTGVSEEQYNVDKLYADAAAENPVIADLVKGGSTLEEIINALSTGDLSGIVDAMGQPFSSQDQQEALAKGMEDNKLYYEAMQSKETADAESALAQKQADYQDYLINSGQAFEASKAASDEQAADQGVLFSGSRVQKEKNLARAYAQDQASNLDKTSRGIADTARNFQYKFGNDASKGLSQYYNLGGNTYNAQVARGGVGTSGLSSVYNPNAYNFQGTANTERKANANQRAAGYLWNKGNKLLATGNQNKY